MTFDPAAETQPIVGGADTTVPIGGPAAAGVPAVAGVPVVAGVPAAVAPPPRGTGALLWVPLLVGALVSVSVGLYSRYHTPAGTAFNLPIFSNALTMKVWLCSLAFVLGLVQLVSALVMYGRIKIKAPSWIGTLHRWSGRLAFLSTVPVAMACLYAFGFEHTDTRVLVHSLFGCLFYGVFTVKMLVLTKRGLAGWVLPLFGALVFTILVGLWSTSALWFFGTEGVKL